MRQGVSAFFAGLIFALGLGIAGMAQPQKVIGFLNIFGAWDSTLAFVMGSGLLLSMLTYFLAGRQTALPMNRKIDLRLILGAILFGVGWGLAGYCPGSVLVSFVTLTGPILIFTVAMLTGMFLFTVLFSK